MKFNYKEFRNSSIENILKLLSNTKQVVLLFLIIAISLSAVYLSINKKNKIDENKEEKKEIAVQKIPSETAYFRTAVEDIRIKTEIKMKYRLPEKEGAIWFGFFPNENVNRPTLSVYHPIFNGLNWDEINNDEYTLFQKNKEFESIEEFLENPPVNKKIIADPAIYEYGVLKMDNVFKLTDEYKLEEDVDYILTTFHKPYKDGDWFVFERTIDATGAFVEDNKMTWYLQLTGVSEENLFYMNGVEVDFRQPSTIIQ